MAKKITINISVDIISNGKTPSTKEQVEIVNASTTALINEAKAKGFRVDNLFINTK